MDSIKERRRVRGQGGFTLIELLVVIAILGILAGVVVFAVGGIGDKGQASACAIDKRTVQTAAEAYRAQNAGYAADEAALVAANLLEAPSAHWTYTSTVAGPPAYAAVAPCT